MDVFKDAFVKGNMFASGIAVDYGASVVVAKSGDSTKQGDGTAVLGKEEFRVVSKQELATDIKVGMRMPSFKVLNQADARPWHFQELLKSNGTWRIVVFPGDVKKNKQRLEEFGKKLGDTDSFLNRFTPSSQRYDSVIELLSVHSGPRQGTTIFDFPEAFRPWSESDGWDYWKVHVDDESYHEGNSEAYKNYGIDPEVGCTVILRPDQYVSFVGDWDDFDALDKFFSGFMVKRDRGKVVSDGTNGVSMKQDYAGVSEALKAGDEAVKGAAGV